MEFTTLVLSDNKYYRDHETSNNKMLLLGWFFATDVGCPATEWDDWIYDDEKGLETGGNITYLEKEGNDIYISFLYADETPEDHSEKLKISRDNLAQLIEDWKKKVCKKMPQEVTMTYEDDTFTLTTSDDTHSDKKSKSIVFIVTILILLIFTCYFYFTLS